MASMELALAALRSADPGEKPNISLVARTTVLANRAFTNVFTVLRAQKKSITTRNEYSPPRNQKRL